MTEFLTTKEVAKLLRIKERKVYDLAASGSLPCSKAMGKLLFQRTAIDRWLAGDQDQAAGAFETGRPIPNVLLGSHDPLLDWALTESQCGIASCYDGSLDGIRRFLNREGLATGLHVLDPKAETWNTSIVQQHFGQSPVVSIEWAIRQRGLIIAKSDLGSIAGIEDLAGRRFTPRQVGSGSQHLFEHLAAMSNLDLQALDLTPAARTETDCALAVLTGKADAAFGLAAIAAQYKLGFVPVIEERFDLVIDRRAYFDAPLQMLFAFCQSKAFAARAKEFIGYDLDGRGRVHFNGP